MPLVNANNTLQSLQFIDQNGEKRFLKDGAINANYFLIGQVTNKLYVAEGFATAATICEATNCAVAVAFNAGNLLNVAKSLRLKHPDMQIIVAADDDRFTEGNPGLTKAIAAAKFIGAKLIKPDFSGISDQLRCTDFNDLMQHKGLEEVKQQILKAQTLDSFCQNEKPAESTLKKEKNSELPFPIIEPYPEPINPSHLLNELTDTIRSFIILDVEQAHATALWIAYSWFIGVAEIAPLAIINAPERSCGKTQLLTVIGRMSYRPLSSSNASVSALFRAIDLWQPTILIDEADTFLGDNHDLHGMINAGYQKGVGMLRSEATGNTFEPKLFPVFGAKAVAGIALEKHLPESTMSRGIIINLRRKLPGESVCRLRHADKNQFEIIASKLARFAADYSHQVQQARPTLPDALSDRDQDKWEGLFALAQCAGDEWLSHATTAALKLSVINNKAVSTSNELLSDIQHVFETEKISKIKTADLIEKLCDDEEAPWSTFNYGKRISAKQVSRQLAKYGITSKTIRFPYGTADETWKTAGRVEEPAVAVLRVI